MKLSLKIVIFSLLIFIIAVLCCSCQHPSDKAFDEWEPGDSSTNGKVTRTDDTVIYDCMGIIYLKEFGKEKSEPKELRNLEYLYTSKISSSKVYFYLSRDSAIGYHGHHYIEESEFLKHGDDINNWNVIEGEY